MASYRQDEAGFAEVWFDASANKFIGVVRPLGPRLSTSTAAYDTAPAAQTALDALVLAQGIRPLTVPS